MTENTRRMWQHPWQYRESLAVVLGILAVGFALQLRLGNFNFFLLQFPVNAAALALLVILCAMGGLFHGSKLARWLGGVPLCVCIIGALLSLTLAMGLTPQVTRVDPHAHNILADLGFTTMTSCWAFVLLYALALLSLGTAIARRLRHRSMRDAAFYCNHIGLWLLMAAAGLGAADMRRFVMHVLEGEVEWRVYSGAGDVLELPIAIRLRDFVMEEYPPNLVLIDRLNGKALPEGKPDHISLNAVEPRGKLVEWNIAVDAYIHQAVRAEDGGFRESGMPASSPAAKVLATRTLPDGSVEAKSGWVSGGGSIPGFFSALNLDETHTVVMTVPEPKHFSSDITVLTRDGREESAILEVNSPLRIGNWMIYQYSYDSNAGKMSAYSSMELVYDPWLPPVYLGCILLMAGSVLFIWQGKGRKTA